MHHTMSFYWSDDIGDFFFNGLTINTALSFTILCAILIILSIVYESMKVHSAKVRARTARERLRASSYAPSETANLLSAGSGLNARTSFNERCLKMSGEAFVFLLHNSLGYALMLTVMIYNGYLFLVVVFGMGLGYFLFGHISMKINMENMQARQTNVMCAPVSSTASEGTQPGTSSNRYHETSERQMNQSISSYESNVTDSCRL